MDFNSISLVTLVVESAWPSHHKIQAVKFPSNLVPLNKSCPTKKAKAVSDCERCSKDELKSKDVNHRDCVECTPFASIHC
uniref:Uncharacterized protein n=1 Tax=Magallana gigas TaxID=29159 RepID=K1QZ90_MAGGI